MKFDLAVDRIVTGPFQENTFLVRDVFSQKALIIDPGDDENVIVNFINNEKLKPLAILNTHAHLDHIGAVSKLQKLFDLPFYLHKNEKMILDMYEQSCEMFGVEAKQKPIVDFWISNHKSFTFDEFQVNIFKTPGHTPGGVCYEIGEHIFVGDTLFHGSIGRTDLPGGSLSQLKDSLLYLIKTVNHDKIIHSGHGDDTKLKHELISNPFLTSM